MGIKNIDFEQNKFKTKAEYVITFGDESVANISHEKFMDFGHSAYTETICTFSSDGCELGRTYIGKNHSCRVPESDSNTLANEYLSQAITNLEEIQTNPKVVENASVGQSLHSLTLATDNLLSIYRKEVKNMPVESNEELSGSIEF